MKNETIAFTLRVHHEHIKYLKDKGRKLVIATAIAGTVLIGVVTAMAVTLYEQKGKNMIYEKRLNEIDNIVDYLGVKR